LKKLSSCHEIILEKVLIVHVYVHVEILIQNVDMTNYFTNGESVTLFLNTQGLQSVRQPDYTPFTLGLNCGGICSQAGRGSAEGKLI
jgi:hypothetical protein